MAAWRRRALAQFPELRNELNRRDYNLYFLFFALLPMSRNAHDRSDKAMLTRIYAYAEWCLRQRSKELWNPAAVSFYEHVFDRKAVYRAEVAAWLSPFVVWMIWGLWEWSLTTNDLQGLRELFRGKVEFSPVDGRPKSPESH